MNTVPDSNWISAQSRSSLLPCNCACLREGADQATWQVLYSISRGLPRLQEKEGKLGRSREGKWLQQNCAAQWGYSWDWTPGSLTPSPVLLPHHTEDRLPALCPQVGWERSCGVSWEVMYCPGQGLQKQWQREISLTRDNGNVDFKHSKSSRALWKTGSAPNAECPLCLEFSTCNSISCTTDIITAPQGTERPDSAPPKLMNKIVQDRKEMRIRENVPPSLWGWSSETWNQTTYMHLFASAQDERVRLKGDERGTAGLWCFALSPSHVSENVSLGEQKRAQACGSGYPRSSYQLKVWPWECHFPPLAFSLSLLSNEGIRPGVSVRVQIQNQYQTESIR